MRPGGEIEFGFVAAAVDAPGTPDAQLYREVLADCEHNRSLGYGTVWMIEHHFSDYFPTPSPLMFLSHLTARFPDLALGTCVLVMPWYNPLRLAEDIAMLSVLCERPLHLGLGRGTAKYEYDAFGLNMEETRTRFRETYEILQCALTGKPFSYQGEYLSVPKEIRIRPEPNRERINLYGAIGSPDSAGIMGSLGLPPICTSIGNYDAQVAALVNWREAAAAGGFQTDVTMPIMMDCIVADTDAEAILEAREYKPRFMQAQIDHYQTDTTDWENTKSYEAWKKIFAGMKARTIPENIDPWTEWQLIGSGETVCRKLQKFIDAGFNHFILHFATPGVPREPRHRWAERFAREVAPHFSPAFARKKAVPATAYVGAGLSARGGA